MTAATNCNGGVKEVLCFATVGVTFACIRMSDRKQDLERGKVMFEHVFVKSDKPFVQWNKERLKWIPGSA